ncbi:nucleotidyltransferase family protein [Chitinimonas arctica]|uniref:Nucleotidyltransferase family protein n=1 Tax=Chitinimonas arctica TaxID=2594795 RepID=A0A516SML8_9NEIS|nr:nucleotidyltransferase family protein [Chitinimonas arctica]QDQ29298.1 nucleotidyltransferase family protein [Chitinimonas arctica]
MRAMILAAGRGERMRPLTDTTPKPLLDVGGTPLIGWHLKRLAAAGVREVVINHAWLGEQIEAALGNGADYGVSIAYSAEGTALETAGGIAKALPLLGTAPFLLLSGDIFSDYPYEKLLAQAKALADDDSRSGHLVLAPTERYQLDFDLSPQGLVTAAGQPRYTYANLAVLKPAMLASVQQGQAARLGPILHEFARQGRISGEVHQGLWLNVGTPADLEDARAVCRPN